MRAAFNEVRRRLLPKVTEQLYVSAKLSFDRKEYAIAATQFKDLLTFLEDADAKSLPALKEFRTLATGFRDLSVAAAPAVASIKPDAPPSAAASTAAPGQAAAIAESAGKTPSSPAPASQGASASSVSGGASGVLGAASTGSAGVLVPPVIVRQQMPLWLGMKDLLPRGKRGQVRVIIDDQGNVEEARVVESVHPVYDALLLSAARTWKYEPAKLDGKPVRYVKVIEVVLKPAS
jgi:TonB family protein